MGYASRLKQSKRATQQHQPIANPGRVQALCRQIEFNLCTTIIQESFDVTGVLLRYDDSYLPELPDAARLYKQQHPKAEVRYLGRDPDNGDLRIRIFPDMQSLQAIAKGLYVR